MLTMARRTLSALSPRRARCADEQGSVIIVVIVIVVVSVVITTLLATVQSNLQASRADQDRTAAFQRANGGIDHALYRFDRSSGLVDFPNATATSLPSTQTPAGCTMADSACYIPVVVDGRLVSFTEVVTVVAGTDPTCPGTAPNVCSYTLTATADPAGQDTQFTVRSVGHDASGRERQAVATISADPLFRDGFFTLLDFTLTGQQVTPIAYDSAVSPDPAVSELTPPINGSLGTNGTFSGAQATIKHFAETWESFNMYGRATQDAADEACAEGECSDQGGTVNPFTDQKEIAIPDIPSTASSCPNGGIFTGTIPPGDYTCPTASFQGTVTIGTSGNGTVRIWPTSRLRFSSNSVVNQLAVPARLQIFYPEPPDQASNDSTICDAEVWALLYTPGLNIACNGSHQPNIYGAVLARLHGGTGNQFEFHWDVASQLVLHNGKYTILDWRECPVGVVC